MRGGTQVKGLSIAAGERSIGDRLHQRLDEAVLTLLCRVGIFVNGDDLLSGQASQMKVDLALVQLTDGHQTLAGEGSPEHRRLLSEPARGGGEGIQTSRDQRLQRL